MRLAPTSRLRAGLVATLAVAALGASASSALADQHLDISDVTVQEGAAGAITTASFTITDHYAFGEAPAYDYAVQTTSVTAGAGDDYVETTDSGGFTGLATCYAAAGCTHTSSFEVPVVGDDVPEDNESFAVQMSSSLPVDRAIATATILNDDAPAAAAPVAPASPAAPATPAATSAPRPAGADDLAPDFTMQFLGMRTSVSVRVACPRGEISCTGRVFVRRDLTHSLGIMPFKLKGGQSRRVTVALTRSERHRLRRAGSFFLRSIAYDAAGNRTVREAWEQI